MKIKMTSVFVPDPAKAHAFYTEVLGFKSFMFMPEAQLAIVVSQEDPNGTALLLEPNQNPIAAEYQKGIYKSGLPCIVMGSDDVKNEYEKLKTRGVKSKDAPVTNEWGTYAVFDDTFGNYIQIHQDA